MNTDGAISGLNSARPLSTANYPGERERLVSGMLVIKE